MNIQLEEAVKQIKLWGKGKEFIPLHEPVFYGNEKKYVLDCIESGWVSSVGKYVDLLEDKLAEYTGIKYAVAVVNGTSALHIALKLAGVKRDEEVLIPSLTFIATANAVRYCDATPHFVDVEEQTLGLDPIALRSHLQEIVTQENGTSINKKTGRIIRAIVPMHTFGHPVDMDELLKVAEEFNLKVVEDAAESLGSFYKGKHTGTFGSLAAVSFNGNKAITTGGGGAILTNNEEYSRLAKHLTTTAKIPHRWEYNHDEVGFNYRMPNINAALGCAQLEQLPIFLEQKKSLTKKYELLFSNIDGISLFLEPQNAGSNYWLQTIKIDQSVYLRDELLLFLNNNGIMSRPIWTPLHELNPYQHCPSADLPITNKLKNILINIPSSPYLGVE
ncbi:LegC family aminotransferase [Litchfieldia salsa]|uniref:Perosamine synthetase n=1 Tax=Litchfieldia salsa TaxID=930152 RepID=A0A1H0WEV2_9BACI|nr:LegC family aminotransferase [Litchfieldia salsa]SDP88816.1 perosamine synthetase [Litchfieldia salsa]